MIAVCFGWFMVIVDATIVNVALPSLGRDFGTSVSGLQWVVDAYVVVFAGLLLSTGWLGDRIGGIRVLRIGLAVFALASVLCGLAPDLAALIAFRAVQGVGAALLVPASLSLIQANYDDRRARAHAIALWGMVGGVAGGCGPVLGGVLTSELGWRWIFFLSVPAAIAGLVLSKRWVHADTPRDPAGHFDAPGQLAGIAALVAITTAMVEGGRAGWRTPTTLGAFVAFVLAAAVFLLVEARTAQPMLPLAVFRSRELSAATMVGFLMNLGFYGQLFVLTLSFQKERGDSAILTGVALLPQTAVIVLGSWLGGLANRRSGPRLPTVAGMLAGAAGFLAFAVLGMTATYPALLAPMAAAGLGISTAMPAVTSAAVEGAPEGRAGLASGILNASRQVGAAVGIALLGSFIAGTSHLGSGFRQAMLVACAAYAIAALAGLLLPDPEA
jgi:DHA2 family methylenomycin A resistance protein-like MFS transporter